MTGRWTEKNWVALIDDKLKRAALGQYIFIRPSEEAERENAGAEDAWQQRTFDGSPTSWKCNGIQVQLRHKGSNHGKQQTRYLQALGIWSGQGQPIAGMTRCPT